MKKIGTVFLPCRNDSASGFEAVDIEISLDCITCKRRARTVIFSEIGSTGICLPTEHEFLGKLTDVVEVEDGVKFELEYEYEPFVDAKYPDEERYKSEGKGAIAWARVHVSNMCPTCRKESRTHQQTNQNYLYILVCDCGAKLSRGTGPIELNSWSA